MKGNSLMLLLAAVATLFLSGGTANAQQGLTSALNPQVTPSFSFGMIGIGTTSTARLNVVNLVRTPPPLAIAQVPCKVELDLYDNQGKLIKQKTIANLGYGQAEFVDLLRSEVPTAGAHVEITGVVKVGSAQAFFCSISPTLEVFDNVTGSTSAILGIATVSSALSLSPLSRSVQGELP